MKSGPFLKFIAAVSYFKGISTVMEFTISFANVNYVHACIHVLSWKGQAVLLGKVRNITKIY